MASHKRETSNRAKNKNAILCKEVTRYVLMSVSGVALLAEKSENTIIISHVRLVRNHFENSFWTIPMLKRL